MLYCGAGVFDELCHLFKPYGLELRLIAKGQEIPGSFWGDNEAGLIANTLLVREDTPVHSAMHEACHYICMDELRRKNLHTDASGDYDEENGVCYLQILLAQLLPSYSSIAMMQDMDEWGYSFRLGATSNWFYQDAEDAKQWLQNQQLIDQQATPTWQLRII